MNKKIGLKLISSALLGTMCLYTMPVLANTKDETVYSKINNNGEKYSTIVSTKLSNDDNSELISDISDLLNIENTNGDETYEKDGNKIVWKANGNNIQYQGKTEKELPVTCTIKYELDGEEVKAEDVARKDGKIKVTLTYTNNEEHTVKVNGKYVKMYIPFVVVAGTIIDNSSNNNISISNGKIIDNGNKTTVIGMAMPGLQESLNISSSKINIPNTIEISMDAKNFEMNNIISYATPKILEEDDLNMFEKLDEVYEKVNELQSSSKQLVDGTNTVNENMQKVSDGASKLKSGISTACAGISTMKTKVAASTKSLLNDKSDAIDAKTLASIGTSASKSATAMLNAKDSTTGKSQLELIGAQASNTASTTLKNQLNAIGSNASTQAVAGLNAIDKTTNKTALDSIKSQTANAQTTQLSANGLGTATYNKATGKYEVSLSSEAKKKIEKTIDYQFDNMKEADFNRLLATQYPTLATVLGNLSKSDPDTATAVKQNIISLLKAEMKSSAISAASSVAGSTETIAIGTATATASQVASNIASEVANQTAQTTATQVASTVASTTAQSTASQVASSVANTTAQSVAAQVGNQVKGTALSQVASQMSALTAGINELQNGLNEINSGANTLSNGTSELAEGTETLASGMTTFNEQGIEKICNYINGDVKDLTSRVTALKDLANEYKIFTDLNDGDKGTVKFITIIDSLKKENFENKEVTNSNTNQINENVSDNSITNSSRNNETSAE